MHQVHEQMVVMHTHYSAKGSWWRQLVVGTNYCQEEEHLWTVESKSTFTCIRQDFWENIIYNYHGLTNFYVTLLYRHSHEQQAYSAN